MVPATWVRAAVTWTALRGLAQTQVQRVAEDFCRDCIPPTLRADAMQRMSWHQQQGDVVAVVTGAFELMLAPWCAQQGVELLGSRLEVSNGVLSGRYLGPQCVGLEKARRVRERFRLQDFVHVHAYGDTPEDHDLLALAHSRHYRGRLLD